MAATIALTGCSTNQQQPAPTNPTTSPAAQGGDCQVNPNTQPMPAAEEYEPVPADARISVTMSGVPSGTVKPGDPPAEVDVTLCNNSPVDYPSVGVTTVLTRCSCATSFLGLPEGSVERFEPSSNRWVRIEHPVITTGMDYLGGFTDVQPLPKGKAVTVRYRISLDRSMTAGKGSIETTVVVPRPLVQVGKADLPFTVLKDSSEPTPPNPPASSLRQSVLPFTGLTHPGAVAADNAGNVYVTDQDRVMKLSAGSNDQTVLPFAGAHTIRDITVDGTGNVYATDQQGDRVLKLAVGSSQPTTLPFTGLTNPSHLAVDSDGNVYVTDREPRVVKLDASSNEQTVLPLSGDIRYPDGLAVDGAGNVYVSDSNKSQLLKLAAGTNDQTALSICGLDSGAFAVDPAGDVFVADIRDRQVLRRTARNDDSTILPFTGLNGPHAVSVDEAGNVYVIDNSGFGRVVKLAAG
nr:NHL repeat-containing protein [Mycobacterium sp. URHB0044]